MCFRPVMVSCALMSASVPAVSQHAFSPDFEFADGVSWVDPFVTADAPESPIEFASGPAIDTSVMGNEDVLELVRAEFSDATIKAAIEANATAFDVTPRSLVALKAAGVSEDLMETMLAIETARRKPAANEPVAALDPPADAVPVDSIALLSQAIERLAAAPPEPPATVVPSVPGAPGPQAWATAVDGRISLTPSLAQVAFTDSKSTGATALRTLEGLSSRKALVFASPALSVANEIGGLFRSGDPTTTAVWALPGVAAGRELVSRAELEIEFAGIPGVNPEDYRPVVVQLVPTIDNFRLVGAAKTKVSDLDNGMPTESIIEEPVAANIERIERGRYRVVLGDALQAGEYALVLRPAERKQRRRAGPASLGELLGAGTSQLLYATWDFTLTD